MDQFIVKTRVSLIDMTPQTKEFDHLRPNGEIICSKDDKFDVSLLEIKLDGALLKFAFGPHLQILGIGMYSELVH